MVELIEYKSIRKDWYYSNSMMPRLVKRCLEGKRELVFSGFPRQWVPLFEWFGIRWSDTIPPEQHIPFYSDIDEPTLLDIVSAAKANNSLRILVEATSMYDPILVDFLYNVDNSANALSIHMKKEMNEISEKHGHTSTRRLLLTGWQSYGRPSVQMLEHHILNVVPQKSIAVALPCSVKRPYHLSPKHKKIYKILQENGYEIEKLHKIVFTSLGILPEETWELPQVLNYDARVPDIYRLLRLGRMYFKKASYKLVLDCTNFFPYSDILTILNREGLIKKIKKIDLPGHQHFHVPHIYRKKMA